MRSPSLSQIVSRDTRTAVGYSHPRRVVLPPFLPAADHFPAGSREDGLPWAVPSLPRQNEDGWGRPASQDDTAAARCEDAGYIPVERKYRAAPYLEVALHDSWESSIVQAVWD